jgi:hypothetical protein
VPKAGKVLQSVPIVEKVCQRVLKPENVGESLPKAEKIYQNVTQNGEIVPKAKKVWQSVSKAS